MNAFIFPNAAYISGHRKRRNNYVVFKHGLFQQDGAICLKYNIPKQLQHNLLPQRSYICRVIVLE